MLLNILKQIVIGLTFFSMAFAGEITLAWDANTEPDLSGYRIYYGTSSHDYGDPVDVGDVTEVTLIGFDDGATYYFAATAYDEDDNESVYSDELVHTFGVINPKPNTIKSPKSYRKIKNIPSP